MNRIKALREERGLSQTRLATLVGSKQPTIQRLEIGKRELTLSWMERFASAFKVTPAEIISEPILGPGLPVKGEIRAGAWLEITEEPFEAEEHVPVTRDHRFPDAPQFALRVVGNSMNRFAKPGTYVVVAQWDMIGRDLTEGDVVVVRRERAMTYEMTLKRAKIGPKGWELWPESDDPRHQEPVAFNDGKAEVEVRITGLVIGKFERV